MEENSRDLKFYHLHSTMDFGQCKGEVIKEIMNKSPNYISWCFQMVDWFCISDEIFFKLPIIKSLQQNSIDEYKYENLYMKHMDKLERYSTQEFIRKGY